MRANCSAYSGFPPARSSRRVCVSTGSTLRSSRACRSRLASSLVSGESEIVVALRLPPPQAARRSKSSGRAVQRSRSGTCPLQSRRCSRKSNRASSAQCRSSTTSTHGRRAAISSRNRRHAVNDSSRLAVTPSLSAPTSGASRASNHVASSTSGNISATVAASLPRAAAASSDSRIPASAFTISPSAQNVMPSPYGRQRPWRQVTRSGRSSSTARSSVARRLFPIPGSPTTVTSCTDDSRSARRNVSTRSVRSCSRPTNGVCVAASGCPTRLRASSARQARIGSAFPFASTLSCSPYAIAPSVVCIVASSTMTDPTGAADWRRAAVFTTSPVTIPSPRSGRAPSETTVSPVVTAARTAISSPSSRSSSMVPRIRSAARTARSASSSCATGAPKTAMTASPMNFSTVPPKRSMSALTRS